MSGFDDDVAAFVAARKVALRRYRWRIAGHRDYAKAFFHIAATDDPEQVGRVVMQAHLWLDPRKYMFAVLFQNVRVLALDVNPHSSHVNLDTGEKVTGTHWHEWPEVGKALPVQGNLLYPRWLDAFLVRSKITYPYPHHSPPEGRQLRLGL